MIVYKIKIANVVIQIQNIYEHCRLFCKDFITDERPVLFLETKLDDINQERYSYEKINGTCRDDGLIETQVVFRKISESIVDYGAFMMHGAAIAFNNEAYIFTGFSGIGKTTHIKKWLRNVPDIQEINGDKPFIIPEDKPLVCGSPWAGKERLYTNSIIPLKAIILLNRAENNSIERKPMIDLFPALCQQIIRTNNVDRTKKTLQMLGSIESKVSFYSFHINNFKEDCFEVAYNALVRGNE